jgi:glutamate/tyrosine decarboxylase-like PLP-dependent enzyme
LALTLDPADWAEIRAVGHRMVDDIVDVLEGLRDQPVWRPVPDEARERLRQPLPTEAIGPAAAYDEYRRYVQPYARGNNHPRFWGWVNGSALPLGILADLLASSMNPSVAAFENAASLVEEQVLGWLKEMLGFPTNVGALLTSGCSMSTIIGLAVARNVHAGADIRRLGVAGIPRRLALYASTEAHASVEKAVELLGIGRESLRRIPVDTDYRIDLGELERHIVADRRAGLRPIAVVANAGTVNTGAIDDLDGIATMCSEHGLWMHVDGAFGALAWLVAGMRPSLAGLQRADSLAFDLHKWLYLPYDVGCVFVADQASQRATFAKSSDYLNLMERSGRPATNFGDLGIELSRRFRALKVWLCLKEHGVDGFARQIAQNIAQARRLGERIDEAEHLRLMAPVGLNVVCFRFEVEGLDEEKLEGLNEQILSEIWSSGLAGLSDTRLRGRFVLRVANTNHRTRGEDFELLVEAVERIGTDLVRGGAGGATRIPPPGQEGARRSS